MMKWIGDARRLPISVLSFMTDRDVCFHPRTHTTHRFGPYSTRYEPEIVFAGAEARR